MPIYKANDLYTSQLRKAWIHDPAETTMQVISLPDNFPTIITLSQDLPEEAVFAVTGWTGTNTTDYTLTGVTWLRGYPEDQPIDSPISCLNNEEYINQFLTYLGINWIGEWSGATAYALDDGVSYQGSSYVSIQAGTNHLPTDASFWALVMSKGDQGIQGIQGEPGVTIIDATSLKNTTLLEDTANTDTYAGSFAVSPESYFVGLKVNLKVINANTGAATLNVNSLGAKAIKKNVIEDVSAGDIKAGQIIPLIYDGTNFQIVGGGGTGGGADVLSVQVFS